MPTPAFLLIQARAAWHQIAITGKRSFPLDEDASGNPHNLMQAIQKAYEWGDRIPLDLFFQSERPTDEESEPVLRRGPVVDQPRGLSRESFDPMLAETM
jgi:hypothetical protein